MNLPETVPTEKPTARPRRTGVTYAFRTLIWLSLAAILGAESFFVGNNRKHYRVGMRERVDYGSSCYSLY